MFVEWIRKTLPAITPTQIPKCRHHFRSNWTWELYSVSHAFNVFYRIFLSYSTTSASMSLLPRIFPGLSGGASGKEPANADFRDMGLIPGSGRSSGGGCGNLLQYSGAWCATVHWVAKSWTWLKWLWHACMQWYTQDEQACLEVASLFQADQTAVVKTKGRPFGSNAGSESSGR